VPAESLWESLLHGRDPRQNGTELSRAQPSSVDGIVCDAEEQRLYILTEVQHLSLFFPSAVTRDRKNSLLLEWEWLKLLPPDLYRIVYTLRAEPGRFRAVPEAKLCLDGYPAPSGKADDPDKAAGFSDRASLRLALYPNALRFFSAGLHEPLRAAGAWPTTLQVLRRGFMLEPEVRRALAAKLDAVAPSGGAPWYTTLRAALRERHWPAGSSEPQPAVEAAAMPAVPEPSSDLLAVIRRAARSVEPGRMILDPQINPNPPKFGPPIYTFVPPSAEYRAALTAANHPDLDASRISRLVQRMLDHHAADLCRSCGNLVGYCASTTEVSETFEVDGCGCGQPWTQAMELRADLCPRCGKDPDTSARPTCMACSEPVERKDGAWCMPAHGNPSRSCWQADLRALSEGRLACFKCHVSGQAPPHGCECSDCVECHEHGLMLV